MPSLSVRDLEQPIEDFVLRAQFEIGTGERAALVGPSGSGKTSLLRLIAGLDSLARGEIFLGSRQIDSLPPEKREVGFVFQDQALFPSLNVLENAVFGLKVRGMGRQEREALGNEWLKKVGLGAMGHSPIGKLSGGEKQRIAFIRALIWKPKVILLDEPFSALDRDLRRGLCRELIALHALCPAPMVLVTHDEVDVELVATRRLELGVNGSIHRVY